MIRKELFAAVLVATSPLAPGVCEAEAKAADTSTSPANWPQFLGPNRNGTSPETGLLEQWPEDGPPIVWSKEIGAGFSAPSTYGNRLVLHHRRRGREIVDCLDAQTGERIWRYTYPVQFRDPYGYNNGPRATPLLTEDRSFTFGADGHLLCLDRQTGGKIWERDTEREWNVPEAFFGVGSSPVLHDGRLLVMVGGQPNAGMVAFDPKSGRILWESVGRENWDGVTKSGWPGEPKVDWQESFQQAGYATPVPATLHGRSVILCLMRQGLVTLNPANGDVLNSFWFRSRVHESVNAANPIVVDNHVFLSAAYYGIGSVLLEVTPDQFGFSPVWRDPVLEIHWSTPIYNDGYVYAFSGRNEPDARFRCIEWMSGKLMWDRDESWRPYRDGETTYGRGSAIMADGKLIVLGETGLLGLFEPSPRKPIERSRWQVPQLEYPCWTGPVLSHRRLYLRSENRLTCLDLSDSRDAPGGSQKSR